MSSGNENCQQSPGALQEGAVSNHDDHDHFKSSRYVVEHVDYSDQIDDDIKQVIQSLKSRRGGGPAINSSSILDQPDASHSIMLRAQHSFEIRKKLQEIQRNDEKKYKQQKNAWQRPHRGVGEGEGTTTTTTTTTQAREQQQQQQQVPLRTRFEHMIQSVSFALTCCSSPCQNLGTGDTKYQYSYGDYYEHQQEQEEDSLFNVQQQDELDRLMNELDQYDPAAAAAVRTSSPSKRRLAWTKPRRKQLQPPQQLQPQKRHLQPMCMSGGCGVVLEEEDEDSCSSSECSSPIASEPSGARLQRGRTTTTTTTRTTTKQ